MMRAGMMIYEFLSGFSNQRFHRFTTREETLSMAPGLPADGLTGGCLYYDAVVSDTRWTIETVKDGVRHGGVAVNHAPAIGLLKEDQRVVAASVHDRIGDRAWEMRGRVVINATGVFADRIRCMDRRDAPPLIQLSKGTHLVFVEEDVPLSVTTVFPSPLDGRPLFLIKREGCFLYGTTDDWEASDPGVPSPASRDVQYLLESLRRFMPEAQLDRAKVQFVHSGFRPLVSARGSNHDPSIASREDFIEMHPSGLISVIGGKLTTARIMAKRVLKRVVRRLDRTSTWAPCRTHKLSIGGTNEAVAEGLSHWVKQCPRMGSYFRILYQRYGLDAHDICAEAMMIHLGKHLDPQAEPIRAELQYVCRHEMVCTLEDLIDRRPGFLYWNADKRVERLRYGAHVIRTELDMTDEEFEQQLVAYTQHLRYFHALPQELLSRPASQ